MKQGVCKRCKQRTTVNAVTLSRTPEQAEQHKREAFQPGEYCGDCYEILNVGDMTSRRSQIRYRNRHGVTNPTDLEISKYVIQRKEE